MNKSQKFFEDQIENFDNEYWKYESKVEAYQKDLDKITYLLAGAKDAMNNAGKERDFYQDLLNDLL